MSQERTPAARTDPALHKAEAGGQCGGAPKMSTQVTAAEPGRSQEHRSAAISGTAQTRSLMRA